MTIQPFKKFEEWDHKNKRVQNDIASGKYVSGKTTLIAFGPPEFRMMSNSSAPNTTLDIVGNQGNEWIAPIPCGEVQGFSQQQQTQLIRLFEIGSERSVVVRGRTFGALQMNRVLYSGASLLKYLYLYYAVSDKGVIGGIVNTNRLEELLKRSNSSTATLEIDSDTWSEENQPGQKNLYWTLNSTLFSIPVGIMLYLKDTLNRVYGAVYFENCYVSSTNASIDEASPIITEGVSIEFEKCLSLNVAKPSEKSQKNSAVRSDFESMA